MDSVSDFESGGCGFESRIGLFLSLESPVIDCLPIILHTPIHTCLYRRSGFKIYPPILTANSHNISQSALIKVRVQVLFMKAAILRTVRVSSGNEDTRNKFIVRHVQHSVQHHNTNYKFVSLEFAYLSRSSVHL